MDENLIAHVTALRGYYAPDNRVGLVLDALLADLNMGTLRQEILAEAEAVRAGIPNSTASRVIDRVISTLSVG